MTTPQLCPNDSDHHFGPRVNPDCRSLDFTLTFEDAILSTLPAVAFLLLLPMRLGILARRRVAATTSTLMRYKLGFLAAFFAVNLAYLIVSATCSTLRTDYSISSATLNIIAAAGCILLSCVEDERSLRPSSLLTLYLSAWALTAIPRLRTLWSLSGSVGAASCWTVAVAISLIALFVESLNDSRRLNNTTRHVTKEETVNFWNRGLFVWVIPLFRLGFSSLLSLDNIGAVDNYLCAEPTSGKLEPTWKKYSTRSFAQARPDKKAPFPWFKSSLTLFKATLRAFIWPFVSAAVPRLCLTGFTFSQPFLIQSTINFVGEPTTAETKHYGQALIGAYVLVYLGFAISTAIYWRQTFRFISMVRAGLISVLYRQTLRVKAVNLQDSSVITLMGTDVERIVVSFKSIHEVWASLIDISIAVYLLERQLFVACVVPALIAAAGILAMMKVSALSNTSQKSWIERVERRLHVTSRTLGDMKTVKMLGLAPILSNIICSLRQAEIKVSRKFRKLLVWQLFLSNFPLDFAPFATFAVFTIITVVRQKGTLVTAQAFTSLSLISLLTLPVLTFIQAVPSLVQCIGCFERIQHFLELEPHARVSSDEDFSSTSGCNTPTFETSGIEMSDQTSPSVKPKTLIKMHNATFAWSRQKGPVLHNINLDIKTSKILLITGSVGSGKSTLLESLLGETLLLRGQTSLIPSFVAYCGQEPWLMNDTIRNNICLVSDFDQKWYDHVVWLCALHFDLKTIPYGDRQAVGSKGVTLSGGQKQRIVLARAIYSRSKILILDDIFSGLDPKTMRLLTQRLFGEYGYFQENKITVILATHNQSLFRYADQIVRLQDGRQMQAGVVGKSKDGQQKDLETRSHPDSIDNETGGEPKSVDAELPAAMTSLPTIESATADLWRRDGDWSVYSYYFRAAGITSSTLFVLLILVSSFCTNFPTLWLKWWSDANAERPNKELGMYLGVYGLLSIMATTTLVLACWVLFLPIITNTAMNLHSDLLQATFRAPLSFFRETDTGTITNRFSQDMDLIDMMLPVVAVNAASEAANCIMKVVILCVVARYLAAAVPFLIATVFILQRCYLRTSRQVRLLDIEAKAPLYTQFLETMSGASVIRAMGIGHNLEQRTFHLINESQKPVYMLYNIQQWLTLVLDLIVGAIAVVLVATTTSLKSSFSGSSIGVAMTTILTFNQALTSLIKFWTLLETTIGAVSRVQRFAMETPSEEQRHGSSQPVPTGWPSHGAIEFLHVRAVHSSGDSCPILDDISLLIEPGTKVAICGRSGSGKTSLVLALLQLIDLQAGSIIIDDLDLCTIPRDGVRSAISTIPQDPFFAPDSIRFNLDPGGKASDSEIEILLTKIGLGDSIEAMGGLESDLVMEDWSVGQRQLLCLARALLLKSKVLIMDEATSSVDATTEATMQDIINNECGHRTVIAVMHRLDHVLWYDRVILLDKGRIVEQGAPRALLAATDSEFAKLYKARGTYH